MDKYLSIGKIVNTHGIKGELRLLSKFKYKEKVFKKGMHVFIGREKEENVINSYRSHKCFDMITLVGFSNINEVLKYKGAFCYIRESDLVLNDDEYLDADLIGMNVEIDSKIVGTVSFIDSNNDKNKIIAINIDNEDKLIPFRKEFVSVDIKNDKIIVTPIEGMI